MVTELPSELAGMNCRNYPDVITYRGDNPNDMFKEGENEYEIETHLVSVTGAETDKLIWR